MTKEKDLLLKLSASRHSTGRASPYSAQQSFVGRDSQSRHAYEAFEMAKKYETPNLHGWRQSQNQTEEHLGMWIRKRRDLHYVSTGLGWGW